MNWYLCALFAALILFPSFGVVLSWWGIRRLRRSHRIIREALRPKEQQS